MQIVRMLKPASKQADGFLDQFLSLPRNLKAPSKVKPKGSWSSLKERTRISVEGFLRDEGLGHVDELPLVLHIEVFAPCRQGRRRGEATVEAPELECRSRIHEGIVQRLDLALWVGDGCAEDEALDAVDAIPPLVGGS